MNDLAESIAHAFIRAINRQDVEAIASLMTEQHRFVDAMGNISESRQTMRQNWTRYFQMVPDYTVAIEETVCDGPVVVMLGVAEGTYAPHGQVKQENHWSTAIAMRAFIEDGKVAEWRVYCDNEPMRQKMAKAI